MAVVTTTLVEVRDPVAHVEYLKDEIQVLKARKNYSTSEQLQTAVSVLENRVRELSSWIVQNY